MEWKKVKLGEICNISIGRTPPRKEHEWFNQTTPSYKWVSIKDMGDCGKFIFETSETISEKGQIHFKIPIVAPNTILLSFKLTVGRIAITGDSPMLTNEAIAQLPINDESIVNKDYLFYYLKSFNYNSLGSTSSIANAVNSKMIRDIDISLPPLETQCRIAAILSSLDDKIENNNRINRNLEAQAQALFKSWFVDFEPWGGIMPEDWKEGTLGDIVTVKRGGSPRPIQDYLSDKGYRWLKISDATAEASPFISHIAEHIKEEGLNKTVFIKQGSLVLSNSATPGLPKFVDLDTCIHDGWLYFPQSYFPNEYLYLLFQRERSYLLSQGNGSVFTNLKTDIVKNLSVTIPAEDVLNSFQKIIGKVFMEILNNQRENQRLAALRDTLLPKLMKGEITL